MRWLIVILILSVSPWYLCASELAPYLDAAKLADWLTKLRGPFRGLNLEEFEMSYQTFVQAQTFRDLQQIYAPENQGKLQIAYPAFIAHGDKPGADRGFGFHVVKRLELKLPGGATKVIDVNEQWAENTSDHGLYLPDEIRIKTRVRDGDRHVVGSERDFLFDSVRLAWDQDLRFEIQRQTRYVSDGKQNRQRRLRVPVSAPISCRGCHDPGAVKTLSQPFLAEGETFSAEAVIQRSFFKKPLAEMHGYKEYVTHLMAFGVGRGFLERVKADLENPREAFAVPGLYEKLGAEINAVSFGAEDDPLDGNLYYRRDSQGAYDIKGQWFLDTIEEIFEGKYRWWTPETVVPRPKK